MHFIFFFFFFLLTVRKQNTNLFPLCYFTNIANVVNVVNMITRELPGRYPRFPLLSSLAVFLRNKHI
ncbi:hypothetical protein ACN38_g3505 [Penicillium nordicum]|uniref:Secreted protein n=1 Tax=Penicillium nordicum TaxID=229535 RepID=A0A0M9WI03_9EURO|nr:hypothetical protein ACN38_g3505 [Penicillium nordicum]